MGVPLLDPLGGLLVAVMIAKTGVDIGWSSVQELIDGGGATRDTVERIQAVLAHLQVSAFVHARTEFGVGRVSGCRVGSRSGPMHATPNVRAQSGLAARALATVAEPQMLGRKVGSPSGPCVRR